ncbi:hypothetical protein KJ918_02940 [Patescibacteria group bacterium]|nr:hypothetical protein [Patescibacteria group bacterium]
MLVYGASGTQVHRSSELAKNVDGSEPLQCRQGRGKMKFEESSLSADDRQVTFRSEADRYPLCSIFISFSRIRFGWYRI